MKIIDWLFYLIGVFFLGSVAHELYHFSHCGGEFIAGLGYIKDGWNVAATWCSRGDTQELAPYLFELSFYVLLISLKIKYDTAKI